MATRCIDLTDDPKLTEGSLISLVVFSALVFLETLLIKMGFFYILVVFFTWLLCNFVFQFSPRLVLLTIKVMFTSETRLTPSFQDEDYIPSEDSMDNLRRFKGSGPSAKTKFESLSS